MEIGAVARGFSLVNPYLTRRLFPADMADAWVVHNIEEVGLPGAHPSRAAREPSFSGLTSAATPA